jgi:hypothetical protein
LKARRLLLLLGFAVVFVAGIGLGEALHDRPKGAGTQTIVRTLKPLTVMAVPLETEPVTTSNH